MADTKLSALALGTQPDFMYGIQSSTSKKYTGNGWHNVIDFGADPTGVGDSTSAIQAAVDYATSPFSSGSRGTIYFPVGTYKITSSVTFETSTINIEFYGEPGALLTGNFADAILKRSPNSPISGIHGVRNLHIVNPNAAGKCVMLHSCVGGLISNCWLEAQGVGAETYNSQSILISTTQFSGTGGIGVEAGNATGIIECDFSGWDIGVRHQNSGCIILGGRFEVNTEGIVLGEDQSGNANQTTSFLVSGMSMESNGTALRTRAATGGTISFTSGAGIIGGVAYGLRIFSGSNIVINGVTCSSTHGFSQAGISLEDCTNVTLIGCGTATWNIANGLASYLLINCGHEVVVAQLPTAADSGSTLGLSDLLSSTVGTTAVGGGSIHRPCMYNTVAWKVVA